MTFEGSSEPATWNLSRLCPCELSRAQIQPTHIHNEGKQNLLVFWSERKKAAPLALFWALMGDQVCHLKERWQASISCRHASRAKPSLSFPFFFLQLLKNKQANKLIHVVDFINGNVQVTGSPRLKAITRT
eukprot:m.115959 g.115959  ORF g.115959 m.115959 type:complete len:131 (+) comp15383_c0_seq2:891-1283(+)